jgi:hypothetical protein
VAPPTAFVADGQLANPQYQDRACVPVLFFVVYSVNDRFRVCTPVDGDVDVEGCWRNSIDADTGLFNQMAIRDCGRLVEGQLDLFHYPGFGSSGSVSLNIFKSKLVHFLQGR